MTLYEFLLNLFNTLVGLLGLGFGIWQFKRASNLHKIINDRVRGLYNDSKSVLEFAKKQNNYQTIAERARAIKYDIIRLDIMNRDLDRDKIKDLQKRKILSKIEADEYRKLSSE